jgi:hypothetical protein
MKGWVGAEFLVLVSLQDANKLEMAQVIGL